jgi:hypothetical protein
LGKNGILGAAVHGCSCHCVLGYFAVKHPCFGSGVFFMDLRQASLDARSDCCAVCCSDCCACADCMRRTMASKHRMATNLRGGKSDVHGRGYPFDEIFQGKMDLHCAVSCAPVLKT